MLPLHRRQRPCLSWAVVLAAAAGYVLVPYIPARFAFLVVALWLTGRTSKGRANMVAFTGLAAFTFTTAFVLTPVAHCLFTEEGSDAPSLSTLIAQGGLILLGGLWLASVLAGLGPLGLRRFLPRGMAVAIWVPLLLAAYLRTWLAELAYAGDECYHVVSAQMARILGSELLGYTPAAVGICLWALIGLALWLRAQSGHKARRSLLLVWAIAALALAIGLTWLVYSAPELDASFTRGRVSRYPGAQPWYSALLAAMCMETWGAEYVYDLTLLRVLPMLCLAVLGLFLMGDPRWRRQPAWLAALGALALLTVPDLHYHGTILYLELPAVLFLWVVLADGKAWTRLPLHRLMRRPSFAAAILLPFMKDTAIVAVVLLWLGREVALRWPLGAECPERRRVRWRDTLWLAFALLLPGILYLVVRIVAGARPYAFHPENILSAALWMKSGSSLAIQFGVLWVVAIAGLVAQLRSGERGRAFLASLLFLGLWAFHFLEDPSWIGFARFHLMLLPPVLVYAWEGLTRLARGRTLMAAGVVAMVLVGNALLTPVTQTGERDPWGGSGEYWYPYAQVFRDIRSVDPQANLLLTNMPVAYGVRVPLMHIGWDPPINQIRPTPGETRLERLHSSLRIAQQVGATWVIVRNGGKLDVPPRYRHGPYVKVDEYPAHVGSLVVFARVDRVAGRQTP